VVYGGMGIKRIWKIIRLYCEIDGEDTNIISIISYIVVTLSTLAVGVVIMDTINNKKLGNRDMYTPLLNTYILNFLWSLNFDRGKNTKKKKFKNNSDYLLKQLPVSTKEIFTARFIIVQIICIPMLLLQIFLIFSNIKTGLTKHVSVCFGIMVIVYCIYNLCFSISTGFNMVNSKRYKYFRWSKVIFIIILYGSMIYNAYYSFIFVNNSNNIFFPFSLIPQIFSMFAGIAGIFAIIISMIVSYYLGCALSLKLSQGDE